MSFNSSVASLFCPRLYKTPPAVPYHVARDKAQGESLIKITIDSYV